MINVYNILNDKNNRPKLNVQREIDIDERNISIEESVEILNHFFNMKELNVEHVYLIGFDNEMNIIGIFLVSIGTCNNCVFYKRSIVTFLILSGTTRFILYHNHPNGRTDVSQDDILSMNAIKLLAKDLDIEFIESVIVAANEWRCIERNKVYEYKDEYDEDDEF